MSDESSENLHVMIDPVNLRPSSESASPFTIGANRVIKLIPPLQQRH